ncbi:MAG: MFS transporter [Alteromonadaceae bacterium]|nr:MFS transporter [Alteromonadaceae bacterium]
MSLSALIISIILLVSGNAFLMTLLGLRMSLEGFNTSVIGWVLVCYSIGFVLGTLTANRAIERAGHIRAFAAFAAILASATLLYVFAVDPVFWAFLRIVGGFSMAGLLLVMESWFSATATNSNRGALFAIYQIVFFLSTAGAQLLVNLGDPLTFVPFSLAAILVTVALVPLALTRMQAPHIETVDRISFGAIFRVAPTGLIGAMMSGLLASSFYAMGPVYATQIGMPISKLATFMASAIVAAMLMAWPIGMICDRYDRRRVLMVAALVACAAALSTAYLGGLHSVIRIGSTGLFVGLAMSIYPIAVAITNDRMESHQIVAASGSLLLSYGIGSIAGPILGASMMDLLGPGGLFVGNAGVLLLLAALTWYRIRHSVDVPVEEQAHFIPTTGESSVILSELDPRNEDFHEADLTYPVSGAESEPRVTAS